MENNEKNNKKKKGLLLLLLLLIALLLGLEFLWKHDKGTGETVNSEQPAREVPSSSVTKSQQPEPVKAQPVAYAKKHRDRGAVTPVNEQVEEPKVVEQVVNEQEKPVVKQEPKIVTPKREEVEETDTAIIKMEDILPEKYTFPKYGVFRLGIRAGVGYSHISRLGGILESYNIRPNFDMSDKGHVVPRIGVKSSWQYKRVGVELGADYTMFNTTLTKHTPQTDLQETFKFRYDIIYTQLLGNVYLTPNLYMGAGVGMAFPFVSRNIDYTTNRSNFYQQVDALTRLHLRGALKKRPQLMPTLKAGYQFANGIELGLEYSFGITDLIETLPNDYSYNEIKNNTQFVSFTVGYNIFLNNKRKEIKD